MTMEGYPDVYVASVCLEANYNQVVKAFSEAEAHKGVSLVIAYAPCAMQGPDGGMSKSQTDAKLAVDSGYWPLVRFMARGTRGLTCDLVALDCGGGATLHTLKLRTNKLHTTPQQHTTVPLPAAGRGRARRRRRARRGRVQARRAHARLEEA